MDKLQARVQVILEEIDKSALKLDLLEKKSKLEQLELEVSSPEIWNNPIIAQSKLQEIAKLKKIVQPWYILKSQVEDIFELLGLGEDEFLPEFESQIFAFEQELAKLKRTLFFSGKFDDKDVIIRITSGVGGNDAQDFAEMVERMYIRWANKNDYSVEQIERSEGEEAGIKTSVFAISGDFIYGRLKGESGVHRLVRISPFNSGGSRETSFALVEILPKIDTPNEVNIDDKDLKIDVFRSGGKGGQSVNTTDSAVRITHIPTNIVVSIQNERSQLQNKETAMRILRGKLLQLQLDQHIEDISKLQAGKSAEWGAQIRNYVLNPYKLVKDTRTKYEEKDVDKVLNGDIDGFIWSYLEKS